MVVSNSNPKKQQQTQRRDRSFGSLAAGLKDRGASGSRIREGGVVGEKEVTFAPQKVQKKKFERRDGSGGGGDDGPDNGRKFGRGQDRRSASGNVFRKM